MTVLKKYLCYNLDDTHNAAKDIVASLEFPACVYLEAEMGAGKTTLCKSIISSYGYIGEVTSPTYNLIQEYPVSNGVIFHMDLYRLNDPQELEFLAIDDLWSEQSLFLIEWPQRGGQRLISADYKIRIVNKYELDQDQMLKEISLVST